MTEVFDPGDVSINKANCLGLIKEHGTPLQIAFSQKVIQNIWRANAIMNKFGWGENIFYSYKTNPVPGVLKLLHQNGAGAEVVSERELLLAMDLGVDPKRIVFNGIYKSPLALKIAAQKGIKSINIDNPNDIEIINSFSAEIKSPISVGLRVRPMVGWQGQFGFRLQDGSAYKAAEIINGNKKLKLNTIHFHLGGSLPVKTYCKAIDEAMVLVKELNDKLGVKINSMDIGGGFPGHDMRFLTLWEQGWLRLWNRPWPFPPACLNNGFQVLEQVAEYFDSAINKANLNGMGMWVEPGRLITGDAQILAVKVVGIRKSGGRTYAVVDGGRVGAAVPLIGETRNMFVLGKEGKKGTSVYDIVGPTCMPGDRLFAAIKIPQLDIGDIICIEGSGAYFVPFETEFSFARPKLVVI